MDPTQIFNQQLTLTLRELLLSDCDAAECAHVLFNVNSRPPCRHHWLPGEPFYAENAPFQKTTKGHVSKSKYLQKDRFFVNLYFAWHDHVVIKKYAAKRSELEIARSEYQVLETVLHFMRINEFADAFQRLDWLHN